MPNKLVKKQLSTFNILNFEIEDWSEEFEKQGEKKFRAAQLFQLIHKQRKFEAESWHNIPKNIRDLYKDLKFPLSLISKTTDLNGTTKFLVGTEAGEEIESVWLPAEGRTTLCVSSQVGCAMGCKFCSTGLMGIKRNLSCGEILSQVYLAEKAMDQKITHIVFMGMGEPLANLDNVLKSIRILTHPKAKEMSPRKITVSTSGLIPEIKRLGQESEVELAVSINATTEGLRDEIMPINKKYPLKKLLKALEEYPLKSRSKITLEYVVLKGLNHSFDDAKRLVKFSRRFPSKINLIPFNPNELLPYERPEDKDMDEFQASILSLGSRSTMRKSRGIDLAGACGQLISKKMGLKKVKK